MKTIITVLLIFIIGFVSAKYFYDQKDTTTLTQEVNEVDTSETNDSDSAPLEENQIENESSKILDEVKTKVNPIEHEQNEKIKNDTKLRDYEKQLESLDQKIDDELSQLKEIDPEASKEIQNKINEKIKKLPGDDELTKKEYE